VNYWLLKTEPSTFSWQDFARDKKTIWDGVRSYPARKWMNQMKVGDLAFIYHSVLDRQIVGIGKITVAPYSDPTDGKDSKWLAVDLVPFKELAKPVTLTQIKQDPFFADFLLVKQSRLSVIPVTDRIWQKILKMSDT